VWEASTPIRNVVPTQVPCPSEFRALMVGKAVGSTRRQTLKAWLRACVEIPPAPPCLQTVGRPHGSELCHGEQSTMVAAEGPHRPRSSSPPHHGPVYLKCVPGVDRRGS
jgi:hypothetical protein